MNAPIKRTLAERMKASQARLSKIEHGSLTHTQLGTRDTPGAG